MKRRDFLKSVGAATCSVVIHPALAQGQSRVGYGNLLILVELKGGNDGLNTVIPFTDEGYSKNRRELRIPDKDILKLDDALGLNPGMKPAAKLFEEIKQRNE